LTSPEIVIAKSIAGKLSFNPLTDHLVDENGEKWMFEPPRGDWLPDRGFENGETMLSCLWKFGIDQWYM
jgi:aconitate hydratase